jgi:hypothetical protein
VRIVSITRRPAARNATGLGDVDHAVGDVGDLGFAGAVREANIGLHAARRKIGVSSGYSDAHAVEEVFGALDLESSATATTILTGLEVAFQYLSPRLWTSLAVRRPSRDR